MRQVTSNFRYLQADGQTGGFVEVADRRLSNTFNYDQNISAAYLSYTASFLKNYTLKAGTRYEYTTIEAQFQNTENEIQIPAFGVLVPSVNLSRKLKNGNTVKAAYNRRIQRPSLQFLNPNVQAANPLNITIGNPELGPEYTNNFEIGYNTFVKGTSVNFTAFARNTNNSIGPLRTPVGGDTILTTYQNIGQEDAYGFSIFTNVNLSNKLTLSGGTDVFYAVLKNNDPNPLYNAGNEGWVPSFRLFGSYNFNKGWGLQLFSFYRGRQVQLQGVQGGFGIYSLSIRKQLMNKKGSLGFGAENFFTSSIKIRNELNSPLITQRSTNTLYNTNFKLTFSYRIGKLNASDGSRRRRKSINNDDLKDGGSDGAQGAVQGGGAPAGGVVAPAGGAPAGSGPPAGGQRPAQGGGQGQRPAQGTGNGQAPQGGKPGEAPTGKPANLPGN
jgi:outer membrane receptor protein involved in Fe transport